MWALVLLIVLVVISIALNYYIAKHYPDLKYPFFYLLIATFIGLLVNLMPALIVFIIIKPVFENISALREAQTEKTLRAELHRHFGEVDFEFRRLNVSVREIKSLPPGVHAPISNYAALDWKTLLEDATELDFSILYCSRDWVASHISHFKSFFTRGGTMRAYFPSPYATSNRFFESMAINPAIKGKILRTIAQFKRVQSQAGKGHLEIFMLPQGINHMSARIRSSNAENLYVFSPFRNALSELELGPPAVILEEKDVNQQLQSYIQDEMKYLSTGVRLPDLEFSRHLTWDTRTDRVIASISLSCNAGCKFCYVDSILGSPSEVAHPVSGFGRNLAMSIMQDPRFSPGHSGTSILLGGYSDPFHATNTLAAVEFLNTLSDFCDNVVHVATRFALLHKRAEEIRHRENLIINFSLSSMEPENGSRGDFVENRFISAKRLKEMGFRVAIYVRPVLPGKTLSDAIQIAQRARDAGIEIVTVGGLYLDDRITGQLSQIGIQVKQSPNADNEKRLILDREGLLRHREVADVEEVRRVFRDQGFEVYSSSMELLQSFKKRAPAIGY